MPGRVYALLVGVTAYEAPIEPLDGCLNDVDLLHDYLRRHVEPASLAVEILTNAEATRANVIARLRSHLGQARAGDVALFQFCGHGARWATSAAFAASSFDGRDEGLVCHDSRRGPGGYDLADKELAVLIAELAAQEAHTVVLLDCCHSGSGTRSVEAGRGLRPRLTHEVTIERPLESYLDGHYARLRDARAPLHVPAARHILLSACERGQLAQESAGHGVFTRALVDVLEASGGEVSYADLFVRCRAAVRARAFDQDPQFEAYGRFDAGAGFLGRPLSRATRGRFLVSCDLGAWTVECGAMQGLPSEAGTPVDLALYPAGDPATLAGTARAVQVGPQRSEIALDFESGESARYVAEVTSLPAAPTAIAFAGDAGAREAVEAALRQGGVHASLVPVNEAIDYVLTAGSGRLALTTTRGGLEIGFARAPEAAYAAAAVALAPAVRQVLQWERCRRLQNHRTAMDRSLVEVIYVERLEDGSERIHAGPDAELAFRRVAGRWHPIHGRMRVRHRAAQPLFVALAYFSDAYGVHMLANQPIAPGEAWATVWGEGEDEHFLLGDGVDQSIERFTVIVSTEKVDDFLLAQPPLTLGDEYGAARSAEAPAPAGRLVHTNEWFTTDLRLRVTRQAVPLASTASAP
jgi:hypothetical protein